MRFGFHLLCGLYAMKALHAIVIASAIALIALRPASVWANPLPQPEAEWYVSAEALGLQLDGGTRANTPLIIDSLTDATLLSAGDVTYPLAFGPRLTLGRVFGQEYALEAVYFGLQQSDAARTVTGDNNLAIPGALGLASLDFFNVDQLTAASRATINNVELNVWQSVDDGPLSVMAGFRYFDLDEQFVIRGADSDTGASSYRIGAQNDLYGAQVGSRFRSNVGRSSWLGVEVGGKAGIYGNNVGTAQRVTDFDNTFTLRDVNNSAGRAAFVGDLWFTSVVRVTDSLQARIGYTMIWAEGIARAANQLDFTDDASSGRFIQTGQGAFLQGITIGLEYGF